MAPMLIIDDDIISKGNPYVYGTLTQRELNTRNAMLVLTILLPVIGATFSFFYYSHAKKRDTGAKPGESWWTWPRLCGAWFVSVAIFGTVVHFQMGRTERITFILACAHVQLEMLMQAYLLNIRPGKALTFTWIAGTFLHGAVLLAPNMTYVFLTAAIVGGTGDLALVAILAYGRKWLFALGALAHLASAVGIFTASIWTWHVIGYNAVIFFAMWSYIGFNVAGIVDQAETHMKEKGTTPTTESPATTLNGALPAINVQSSDDGNKVHDTDIPCACYHSRPENRRGVTEATLVPSPQHKSTPLPNGEDGEETAATARPCNCRTLSKRPASQDFTLSNSDPSLAESSTRAGSASPERQPLISIPTRTATTSTVSERYMSPFNPLKGVKFTTPVIIFIYSTAFIGALTTSLTLAFFLPWELPRGMPPEDAEKIVVGLVEGAKYLVMNPQ